MRAIKNFDDFVREGIIRKISQDKERAKSLAAEAERKMHSLNEQLDKLGIKDGNANDYVEHCYNIIMYLIRAKLYLECYSASGQGAHEAEVAYMKFLGFDEIDVRFADQMRYFRNGILYYGTILDKEYAEKVINFTKRTYNKLKQLMRK